MNKGKLTEVIGDVTTPQRIEKNEVVFIPHCCNDIGKMGAGVALAIKRKWEDAFYLYASHIARIGQGEKNLGSTVFWNSAENGIKDDAIVICNMIAQHGFKNKDNPRPLNYNSLVKCMNDVAAEVITYKEVFNKCRIHCPMFGGDLAGGNFDFVKCLIEDIWLEAGIDVVIYEYVG